MAEGRTAAPADATAVPGSDPSRPDLWPGHSHAGRTYFRVRHNREETRLRGPGAAEVTVTVPALPVVVTADGATNDCADGCCAVRAVGDAGWLRTAGLARQLAWASLVWMTAEGALGLTGAVRAGSVSLLAWALSSVVEGMASVVVIWRFSGTRTLSETSERRAQQAVAVTFWLLVPFITADAAHGLVCGERPGLSVLGIVTTAASVAVMPLLGRAKQLLGARLESAATAGEGLQNWLCAGTAAAVLVGLIATAAGHAWWLDAALGLTLAVVAAYQGQRSWRGHNCC